jgi:hypothetical protein
VRVGADLVLEHLELDGLLLADAAVVAHRDALEADVEGGLPAAHAVDEDAARVGGRADDAHAEVLADVAVDGHGGAEALEVGVLDELAHVGPVEDDARRVHAVHVLDPLEGDARADRVAGGGARVGRAGVAGGRGRVVAGARLAGGAGRARGGERHAGDEVADAGARGAGVGARGGAGGGGHAGGAGRRAARAGGAGGGAASRAGPAGRAGRAAGGGARGRRGRLGKRRRRGGASGSDRARTPRSAGSIAGVRPPWRRPVRRTRVPAMSRNQPRASAAPRPA